MAQQKFKNYRKVMNALIRDKIKNSGKVTTLLLNCFLHLNGDLKADFVVSQGLCEKNKFTEWRKTLEKSGWIVYQVGDYSKHKPGKKLIKYINEEQLSLYQTATKDDVAALADRMDRMEIVLNKFIEQTDPPVTKEKFDRHLKLAKA